MVSHNLSKVQEEDGLLLVGQFDWRTDYAFGKDDVRTLTYLPAVNCPAY